jgi:NADPH:quinone reductase-like Zn-dependent oxidoreductase
MINNFQIDYVLAGKFNDDLVLKQFLPMLRPGGKIVAIDAPGVFGVKENLLKAAFIPNVSILTELVFTKAIFPDKTSAGAGRSHGEILELARSLFESGRLQSVVRRELPFSAAGLQQAQEMMENATAVGKVVLDLGGGESNGLRADL